MILFLLFRYYMGDKWCKIIKNYSEKDLMIMIWFMYIDLY